LVYIGDLTTTDVLQETKDLSVRGTVSSIRWRPGTSELFIAGGTNTDTRYLIKYNVATKKEEDLSFVAKNAVVDLAFSADGNQLYFIQKP
jgi:hypothetical protein